MNHARFEFTGFGGEFISSSSWTLDWHGMYDLWCLWVTCKPWAYILVIVSMVPSRESVVICIHQGNSVEEKV